MERKKSKIFFEGVSAESLAQEYGTPLYVYEVNRIRENYQRFFQAFRSRWSKFKVFYAVKANSNPAIAQILFQEGAHCDCASSNEIRLANQLGLSGAQILFSGNNLSDEDLKIGLATKALFNLDDLSLLPRLLKFGKPEVLSFRVNPDYGKSNVHESDVMAGHEAKFGIPWEGAEKAYARAVDAGVKRFGVHMMTGSCVTDPNYFAQVTIKLMECIGPIAKKLKIQFEFVDIGGGFGIPYQPEEKPLDMEETAERVTQVFKEETKKFGLGEPTLVTEPGRYFVGDAGFLIGRVHSIKNSYKKFIGTDVSMSTLARPMIYGAYHGILVDGKEGEPVEKVTLCGQACENNDAWGKERLLPEMKEGDLIVVENAGAYGYCMSFPYNGRLRPAEVLVEDRKHHLIRRRETFEDWLSLTTTH